MLWWFVLYQFTYAETICLIIFLPVWLRVKIGQRGICVSNTLYPLKVFVVRCRGEAESCWWVPAWPCSRLLCVRLFLLIAENLANSGIRLIHLAYFQVWWQTYRGTASEISHEPFLCSPVSAARCLGSQIGWLMIVSQTFQCLSLTFITSPTIPIIVR